MVDLEVLLRGRAIIVSITKISKMGMVCIIYGEMSKDSGPKLPPLDPPLMSLTEVANVDSTV